MPEANLPAYVSSSYKCLPVDADADVCPTESPIYGSRVRPSFLSSTGASILTHLVIAADGLYKRDVFSESDK